MTNKKVVFYHDVFPLGGAEKATIKIAEYVHDKGYDIYVITSQAKQQKFSFLKVIEIPENKSIHSIYEKEAITFIINFIQSNNIDIFFNIMLDISLSRKIKENTTCKVVWALHSIPLWEATDRFYRRKTESCHSFWKSVKWYTLTYINYHILKGYNKKYIKRYKEMYHNADALVVLCEAYKNQLSKYFNDNQHIYVIPNSEKLCIQPQLEKKKQIIYAGRLSYADKRVDRLLAIWKRIYKEIPEWKLIIVGDGPERHNLEALSAQWKLERIHFAGYSTNIENYYKDSTVLCLTSTFEGWPLCLTEAQANGVIPIAFNCSAGIETILSPNKKNGILIPKGDIDRFAKELISLINSPQLIKEIQSNILKKVNDYSIERIGRKWINLFDNLTKK